MASILRQQYTVIDKKTGKWRSFAEIMKLTMGRLGKIKNEAERAGLAFKLFGLRGIATFSAFNEAGTADFANLIKNIKRDSVGTAEAMARIKQQSLHGQWLLLCASWVCMAGTNLPVPAISWFYLFLFLIRRLVFLQA